MGTKYSLTDANKILEEKFNKPNGRFYEAFNDPKKTERCYRISQNYCK